MTPEEEEIQLQEALKKLQSQIDEQRILVKKMLSLKQKRIEIEKRKLLQLKAMVVQQNHIEDKELKKSNKHENALDQTKESINIVENNSKINKTNGNSNTINNNKNKIHPRISTKQQIQDTRQANAFLKRIINNRTMFYYKNRFFFSGYKFLLVFDETKFLLVSTQHELTKKSLVDADPLPLFITYKGKSYIKTPTGDYQIENLNQRYSIIFSFLF